MPSAALLLALAFALCAAPAHANWFKTPDPMCKRGLFMGGVCCPRGCGTCGGDKCGVRSRATKSVCCVTAVRKLPRDCRFIGAPCKNVQRKAPPPDPTCKGGLFRWRACCPKACGTCGGAGCGPRGANKGTVCCTAPIRAMPSCTKRGPPCSMVGLPIPKANGGGSSTPNNNANNRKPSSGGGGKPSSTKGSWRTAPVSSGKLTKRHEACAVMVNGLVYLVGGRGVGKPVSIYNPKTKTWTNKPGKAGVEMHHMQCVAVDGKIWIISSWTGKYPKEQANTSGYVYNIASGTWSNVPAMPAARRRGGAAVVHRGDFLYVVGGNRGGHGDHAKTLGEMDAFNWRTRKWSNKKYPDLPVPRDHTGGGMVNGRLCVAGGRDGGTRGFFWNNKKESYCYNFGSGKWEKIADLPTPRGGVNVGTSCDGGLVVAGGEGNGQAYNLVHVFNGSKWVAGPRLKQARHGSGVAVSQCGCGHMFIPSGSGDQGGNPELFTTEEFIPSGSPANCASY